MDSMTDTPRTETKSGARGFYDAPEIYHKNILLSPRLTERSMVGWLLRVIRHRFDQPLCLCSFYVFIYLFFKTLLIS